MSKQCHMLRNVAQLSGQCRKHNMYRIFKNIYAFICEINAETPSVEC